jgi:hypothetical protein
VLLPVTGGGAPRRLAGLKNTALIDMRIDPSFAERQEVKDEG